MERFWNIMETVSGSKDMINATADQCLIERITAWEHTALSNHVANRNLFFTRKE